MSLRPGSMVLVCVASLCLLAGPLAAQDIGRNWLSAKVGQLKTEVGYDVDGLCQRNVEDQDAEFAMIRHSFHVFAPLWQNEKEEFAARVKIGAWDLDTDARLSGPNVELPDELWDLQFGAQWRRKLDNGWIAGAGLEIGSPSDKPFDSCEEVTVNAMGSLRIPAGERDAWLLLVQYSNNRPFLQNVPIPGVAYQWIPDPKRLRAVIGVPFSSLYAEPIDRMYVRFRYMMIRRIHAEVGYRVLDPLTAYLSFDWDNDRFLRADRSDSDDRLFYYEKRLTVGLRWRIMEGLSLDVFGGYAFDRLLFEGEKYDDRNQSRINISDGTICGLKARWRF